MSYGNLSPCARDFYQKPKRDGSLYSRSFNRSDDTHLTDSQRKRLKEEEDYYNALRIRFRLI